MSTMGYGVQYISIQIGTGGFNKNIISQIIKILFVPTLLYASHTWMDEKNMNDIKTLQYIRSSNQLFGRFLTSEKHLLKFY